MTLKPADPDFLAELAALLPPDTLREAEPRYLEEPRGKVFAPGGTVALPRSTEEVAVCLRQAAAARVGVIPYGGGTGLVSGQLTPEGPAPLILSLEKMNVIRDVRPEENVLVAEAGVVLAEIHRAAEDLTTSDEKGQSCDGELHFT